MNNLFLSVFLVLLAIPQSVFAYTEGVLSLEDDHKVYYRYQKAEQGKDTVVLLNGLIYAVENWDEYFQALSADGTGVLQLAYSTQPESLSHLGSTDPYYAKMQFVFGFGFVQRGIETQDLVDEAMAVIDELGLQKFSLVSLSYGSIVAAELAVQQKDRINHLIFMAPAVVTSGRYNPYGASRHTYYEWLSTFNIYANHLYDTEIGLTLSVLVTANKYSHEVVPFPAFYSGVYQMARSSKWFDLKHYAGQDLPPTSLFVATLEENLLSRDQKVFWELMNENPARKSIVTFEGSYHAIPGVAPEAAADWTLNVLSGKIQAEHTVKVGTGNPPDTTRESLIDYSELTEELWKSLISSSEKLELE